MGRRQTFLALDQNNSGTRVQQLRRGHASWAPTGSRATSARMYGFCGSRGLPSCRTKAAVLVLTWKAGTRFYVVYSSNEWRGTLVAFARHLRFR